jgi:tripartite-type tricarboxylate transporter receptor subunit TctC
MTHASSRRHETPVNRPGKALLLTALTACAAALAFGDTADAEPWPSRPIMLTVVGPAGSAPDAAARDLVRGIGLALRQPIVIENMPGAGGIIGMQNARSAAPDGHRFVFTHNGAVVINPALFKALSYDPVADFDPVSLVLTSPMILVASASLGVDRLDQLLELAKRQPSSVMYGSPGIGSPPHVFVEQLKAATSLSIDHVPFKGSNGMVQGLLGGQVGVGMESATALMPLIESGKVRALAVSGDSRMEILPQVPTFNELGVPGIGLAWLALMAPKGTPVEAIAAVNREVTRVLALPDLRSNWTALGRKLAGGPPEVLAERIRAELPLWRDNIERAAIRPE